MQNATNSSQVTSNVTSPTECKVFNMLSSAWKVSQSQDLHDNVKKSEQKYGEICS